MRTPWAGGDILALDLATTLGWAYGPPDPRDGLITYGSIRLGKPGEPQSLKFANFMKWLGGRMLAFPPRVLAYESPASPEVMRGKTTFDTHRLLMGLPAIAEAVAGNLNSPPLLYEASVPDIRRYILGAKAKAGEGKKLVFEKMVRLGFKPDDDNVSDALAVHRFFAAEFCPELRVEMSPLFTRRIV